MIKALLYKEKENKKVQCLLCSHFCFLQDGEYGKCRVRKNIGGILYSLNSDKIAVIHADPIEKKPLYHFLPSSVSLSIAAMGCNFKCSFCQNHSLSQVSDETMISGKLIKPKEIVNEALAGGSDSISYTYSEPTVFFELMLETAKLARERGLKNVMVTNGYFSPQALEKLSPYMDGANIDLKAFDETFYEKYCQGRLKPVLDSIREAKNRGIWIELTTLLIPELNTNDTDKIINFILKIDPDMPWHVSRFHPQYKEQSRAPTSENLIMKVLKTGKEKGLKYLYAGNIYGGKWENTYCPECQSLLIERSGYYTHIKGLTQGVCVQCNTKIPGVWE